MISPTQLQAVAAGVYGLAFLVLLGWTQFVPQRLRRYCYPMVAVVGFASLATGLEVAGVGSIAASGSSLSIPNVAEGVVAYGVVWGLCGWLADVDRWLHAVVVAIPVLQVVSFLVAIVISPLTALLGAVFIIVGYVVLAYLFLGPIWRGAQDLPRARRLLHWKCRNLLLFLTGVLILFATISVTISLTPFVATLLTQYIEMLIRIGIAGFLFANVEALESRDRGEPGPPDRDRPIEDATAG